MSTATALVVALLLLLGNAFFVGAEFALVSARRTQIEPRAEAGSRFAKTTLRAMENISLVIGVNQLGITVCSLVLGAVGEPAVVAPDRAGAARRCTCPSRSCTRSRSLIALAIVVYLHVVLGEMIPKNLALAGPDRAALVLGPPIWAHRHGAAPGHRRHQRGRLRRCCGWWASQLMDEVSSTYTREEVAALVEESRGEGLLEADEYDRLAGALGFTEKTVRLGADARRRRSPRSAAGRPPPTSRRCAPPPASAGSRSQADERRAARLPAHQGRAGARRGAPATGRSTTSGSARSRPSPTDDPLHDALETLQRRGAHMARVVDADGSDAGARDARGRHRGAGRRDPRRGPPRGARLT